ncbi:hypothetical protein GGR50DRAFT_695709 [Xylaria sp. CBS 124048]|nr:hypothetical protein GGR50DRAFT_695709 [Xylaria sp. CBS 124048]
MADYSTERAAGREHILLYPKGFVATRIIQLVIGIACLGLSAYAISVLPITGIALTLFTSLATIISSIYLLVAHFGSPKAYNYWAILGLDIFLVIFWLISFALLAAQSDSIIALSNSGYYYYYYGSDSDAVSIYGAICAAAAGLGGVEWVIYVVTLVIHSIALHRHRKAGLHVMPGVHGDAGAQEQKIQMQPQQPQAYEQMAQNQQTY